MEWFDSLAEKCWACNREHLGSNPACHEIWLLAWAHRIMNLVSNKPHYEVDHWYWPTYDALSYAVTGVKTQVSLPTVSANCWR